MVSFYSLCIYLLEVRDQFGMVIHLFLQESYTLYPNCKRIRFTNARDPNANI
jgi:hypothetical protein